MIKTKETDIKNLLNSWRSGDTSARDKLFEFLYIELRKISGSLLRREGGISLSTGDLVNEAVMRLIPLDKIEWNDKAHFLALSSRMMRRVLIDHARKKKSNKRHHQKITLVTNNVGGMTESHDIYQLESALRRLHAIDKDRAKIVEMRYFGGLSLEEVAEVMGISTSSVKRSWRVSRAWLLNALEEEWVE